MRSSRTWGRNAWWIVMSGLLFVLAAGCNGKNSTTPSNNNNNSTPIVTAQMAGVWRVKTVATYCNTTTVVDSSTTSDTLCAGANLGQDLSQTGGTPCTITPSGSGYQIVCTYSQQLQTGCNLDIHASLLLTYTNTTYTATGDATTSVDPAGCVDYPSQCLHMVITGTRIGPVPAGACP